MQAIGPNWKSFPLLIGCPVRRSPGWMETVYRTSSDQKRSLSLYSQYFGTVEGNATFYSIPPIDRTRVWAEQAVEGFQFCFKVPRLISHELRLVNADRALDEFLQALSPLHEKQRLGPTFLQLGPNFSSQEWNSLSNFLRLLPSTMSWAVEFRHRDWFGDTLWQKRADDLLSELNIDRVLFDASFIHGIRPRTETERVSQGRKPNSPRILSVTGRRPMLRLVGCDLVDSDDAEKVIQHWSAWIDQVVEWTDQGLNPIIFVHTPDDRYAPNLTRLVYRAIQNAASDRGLACFPDLPTFQSTAFVRESNSKQSMFNFDDYEA